MPKFSRNLKYILFHNLATLLILLFFYIQIDNKFMHWRFSWTAASRKALVWNPRVTWSRSLLCFWVRRKCNRLEPSRPACLQPVRLELRWARLRARDTEGNNRSITFLMTHATTYVFRICFWIETGCGEKKNVWRRFAFLQFRVGSLGDVVEQFEDFLVSLCLECNAFFAAASRYTNWNLVCVEMSDQSFCARHETNWLETLHRKLAEIGYELIQCAFEVEIGHANLTWSSLCRSKKFNASLRR